ncbi:small multi-drug export protein [Lentibacillus jeotgali]|uniref:small multi-drug export protein n=1 Tax=Lentibacillus jeotgali TaxID=558169 RepID=UPI000262937C|nr:small multi-drug export protein [Lentibacillus jeotgali]
MENVLLQCIFIFFISMVPFLEVFLTVPTAIIVFNFPPFAALIVAILGNAISVLFFVFFGTEINKLFHTVYNKLRKRDRAPVGINPRIKRTFDRFGATGVCFLSSILFSSQIGAGAITTLGASRNQVFIWTTLGVSTLAVIMATLSVVAEGLVSSLVNL